MNFSVNNGSVRGPVANNPVNAALSRAIGTAGDGAVASELGQTTRATSIPAKPASSLGRFIAQVKDFFKSFFYFGSSRNVTKNTVTQSQRDAVQEQYDAVYQHRNRVENIYLTLREKCLAQQGEYDYKAERYNEVRLEYESALSSTNALYSQLARLTGTVKQLQKRYDAAQIGLTEAQDRCRTAQTRYGEAQQRLTQATEDANIGSSNISLEVEVDRYLDDTEELNAKVSDAQAEMEAATAELDSAKKAVETANGDCSNAQQKLEDATAQLTDARKEEANSNLVWSSLHDKLVAADKERVNAENVWISLVEGLNKVGRELLVAEQHLSELTAAGVENTLR